MSRISAFMSIENKHDVYRGKDFMKAFCEYLREHTIEIINFLIKTNLLPNERQKSYENAKLGFICKE